MSAFNMFFRDKHNPEATVWVCPVHGEAATTLIIFGSHPLCPACIKEHLNKSFPAMEPKEKQRDSDK